MIFFVKVLISLVLLAAPTLSLQVDSTESTVLFIPPPTYLDFKVNYGRLVSLPNDVVLATWANLDSSHPTAPIWRSPDGGATFSPFSEIRDQVNGLGLGEGPTLYRLPNAIGDLPAGTILYCALSVSPLDRSKGFIDLYASKDQGKSWLFLSHVAEGKDEKPVNGKKAIWEPHIVSVGSHLLIYFSDQRDARVGQKISLVTSPDGGKRWSRPTDVVATYDNPSSRPGMPVVAKLGPADSKDAPWMLVYENWQGKAFDVYYKVAPSPLEFGKVKGVKLHAVNGDKTVSSPYVIWVPHSGGGGSGGGGGHRGGKKKKAAKHTSQGATIVSCGGQGALYVSHDMGRSNKWQAVHTSAPAAFSRALQWDQRRQKVNVISVANRVEVTALTVT